MNEVTHILQSLQVGDAKAEELLPLVYEDLRKLAASKMAQQPPGQTIQATALVHEAWLKLAGSTAGNWCNRQHFFRAAAEAMRQILIDRARRRLRLRHGQNAERVDLDGVEIAGDTTVLRDILDRNSERIGIAFKDQPEVEAELCDLLGKVYEHIGEYSKSEAMHRRALEITRASGQENVNVATSLGNLAIALERQGKFAEAETNFLEALAMDRRLLGHEHPKVAKDLTNLGNVLWRQNRLAEAEQFHREALAMSRKLLGNEHPDTAGAMGNLALLLAGQHKPAEAETLFREALAVQRKLLGDDHPVVAQTLSNLGHSLADQNKLADAEGLYREALALRRKLLGNDHPDLATSLNNLGELLMKEDKFAKAEAVLREALAIRRKRLGNTHAFTLLSLKNLATALDHQGASDEAEALRREARTTPRNPDTSSSAR